MKKERLKVKIAVYLMLIKNNELFLMRRFQTGHQDGNYGMISGHVEENESAVDALVRETKEEVGIEIKKEDVVLVHTQYDYFDDPYINLYFEVFKWSGEPENIEKDKCDNVQWFGVDALPENMVPYVKLAVESFKKEIKFSEFSKYD